MFHFGTILFVTLLSVNALAAVTLKSKSTKVIVQMPKVLNDLGNYQWLELPNTKIRSVATNASDPTLQNIIGAWSGGTVDPTRNRLLVWGGGVDYNGNEMYALDLPSLSIKRVVERSPGNNYSCDGVLTDGAASTRHTYDGLTFINHLDRFFSLAGNVCSLFVDPIARTYNFTNKRWEAGTKLNSTTGSPVNVEYDSFTKLVYIYDGQQLFSYDPNTYVYTVKANLYSDIISYRMTGTIDTKRRKWVLVGDGKVATIDLNTFTLAKVTTVGPPPVFANAAAPGAAYDPVTDRVITWPGGSNVYALDMNTNMWTKLSTIGGPTTQPPQQGTFGRWGYIPEYKVFALINSVDENAWVFRTSK